MAVNPAVRCTECGHDAHGQDACTGMAGIGACTCRLLPAAPAVAVSLAALTIGNTEDRSSLALRKGDVISDGMGSYYEILERSAVSGTIDNVTKIWVRVRCIQGAAGDRTFRYGVNDQVLAVKR